MKFVGTLIISNFRSICKKNLVFHIFKKGSDDLTSYERYELLRGDKSNYQVSKDTGISQVTLSEWKSGKSVPNVTKRAILAKYFKVSIEELMDDKELAKVNAVEA